MINRKTVFILGAGASWHYGYPTGEVLVGDVIALARRFSAYCTNRLKSGQLVQSIPNYVLQKIDSSRGVAGAQKGWTEVRDECELLVARLDAVKPLVIDYFLGWNKSLSEIGTMMVSGVILECEANWIKERANQNRRLILLNDPQRIDPAALESDS